VGYICDAKGYRIDPERYEALKNVKIPDTPTQLRKFLGLANTFRSTIRNYATLASPLHKIWTAGSASLKGKGRKVYEEAFNALRAAIVEDVKLFFPNYAYSMVLRVDASLQGVGAYLLQINDKEEEEPIVFFSQAFSDVATRWSTIEQEAYAIYYGVTKCESYLMGQPFFLETDHRNLLYIDKATAPKVVRWKLILQQYNFRLVHIPGVTNVIADTLSRLFAMSAEAQGLPPRYKLKSIGKSASPYNSSNGPGNISRTKRRNLDVKHGSGTVTKRLKTIPLDEVDWNPDDPDDVMSSHQEDSDQPDQDSNGRESAGEAGSKQYTVVRWDQGDSITRAGNLSASPVDSTTVGPLDRPPIGSNRIEGRQTQEGTSSSVETTLIRAGKPPEMQNELIQSMGRVSLANSINQANVDNQGVGEEVGEDIEEAVHRAEKAKRCCLQIFNTYHNETVGHHGVNATCDYIKNVGKQWRGYHDDVAEMIRHCATCQKVRLGGGALIASCRSIRKQEPFEEVCIDTLGPFPADPDGYQFVNATMDSCTNMIELTKAKNTGALQSAAALVNVVGRYGIPRNIRTDGGPEFKNVIINSLMRLLKSRHLTTLAYTPTANGLIERGNREILKHLRAILFNKDVVQNWSTYLPLVQRIMNYSYCKSIGTYPARLLYGDRITADRGLTVAWDKESLKTITAEDYVQQLNEQLRAIVTASQKFQREEIQEIKKKYDKKHNIIGKPPLTLEVGDYVLMDYPDRPTNKALTLWQGPFVVIEVKDNDIVYCQDLVTNKINPIHIRRLSKYFPDPQYDPAEARKKDKELVEVEEILDHRGQRTKHSLQFLVRWKDCPEENDSWERWSTVRDLENLDRYLLTEKGKSIKEICNRGTMHK
jgi:phospholipid-translocating ATPase